MASDVDKIQIVIRSFKILTHNDKVENKDHIGRVSRMASQFGGVQPGIGDCHGHVRPVLIQDPLLRLNVDCLNLKELDDVIKEGEGDDWEDVTEAVAHVALLEWQAHRHKPLNCHSNNLHCYFKVICHTKLQDFTRSDRIPRLPKMILGFEANERCFPPCKHCQ